MKRIDRPRGWFRILLVLVLAAGSKSVAVAQTPAGTIRGMVQDQAGAIVQGAEVLAVSAATGVTAPTVLSSGEGHFAIPELPPGDYEINVRAKGFQEAIKRVRVETGATSIADFPLQVEGLRTTVEVDAPTEPEATPTIGGAITRAEIETLPLNGLNFLELGKTEPGIQAAAPAPSGRMFVPTLGAPGGNNGRGTRSTVDGASMMAVGNGGSAMSFSSEVIEEFRISTVNLDLSTGLTATGAINAVTRSGGRAFTGTAYFFLRDHKLAAYPVLNRSDADPDPFFQRRQFGVTVGGPIRKDRAFFFGSWQRNDQRAAVATTLLDTDFAHLSRITTSPSLGDQYVVRIDGSLTAAHKAFARFAHDGNKAFAPAPLRLNAYPSNWPVSLSRNRQGVVGLTSVLSRNLVHAIRASYFFNLNQQDPTTGKECPGCLGIGSPTASVQGSNVFIGGWDNVSVSDGRRFQVNDWATLQVGSHFAVFGVDWEHNRGGVLRFANEPATLTLYSPTQARQAGISVPASFNSIEDVLSLPLRSLTVGVGDPRLPQPGGDNVRRWNTVRLHFQDSWRVRRTLTFNYGLAWSVDRNLNYDLTKPRLLAPILGEDGLRQTPKQWRNFSPAAGFAWSVTPDTVVRGGSGIYYDFLFPPNLDSERAALSRPGLGRLTILGSLIGNPLAGIAGVPLDTPLDFTRPTAFLGSHLVSILQSVRDNELLRAASASPDIQQIQLNKATGADGLNTDFPTMYAIHASTGVRRQLTRSFELGADFVFRRFVHVDIGAVDANRFRSARGPLIPVCAVLQRNDPNALCSRGSINVRQPVGLATYKGLLVRAEKRMSAGHWFQVSWAYSRNVGTSNTGAPGFNLDNWHENTGPLNTDVPHIVNAAGSVQLPWRLQMGMNFSYSSVPGFSASLDAIDLNGDGTTGDLLPGSTFNAFNRGMNQRDLERLVAEFNQNYAGKTDGLGVRIPALVLPERYAFNDSLHTLDLRLTRSFDLQERYRLTLIGEVFNAYNAANLSGHSGNLTNSATFGQPTARSSQILGSGGPRAFQLAARVRF